MLWWPPHGRRRIAVLAAASVLVCVLLTGVVVAAKSADLSYGCTAAHHSLMRALAHDNVVDVVGDRFSPTGESYTYCDDDDEVAVARATYVADRSVGNAVVDSAVATQVVSAGWTRTKASDCFSKDVNGHRAVLLIESSDPDGTAVHANVVLSMFGFTDRPARCGSWY